jgi:hypothetical protein
MNKTITFQFTGTHQEFQKFIKETFTSGVIKNLRLTVSGEACESGDALIAKIQKWLPTPLTSSQVDQLHTRMGEIMAEVRGQRKIQAIKLLREITNGGLKECKDIVEQVLDPIQPAQVRIMSR